MARGGNATAGAVRTIPIAADTFGQWADQADPADVIVYAFGPERLPDHPTFQLADKLRRQGLINTHLLRRPDRDFDFLAVRRWPDPIVKAPPRHAVAPDEEDLDQLVYRELKRAANLGHVCPTNLEIARACSLRNADAASWRIRKLIAARLIAVEDGGPKQRRIVTILASGKRTVAGAL